MVLTEIAQKITVPIRLPIAKLELTHAVTAAVFEDRLWAIHDRPASIPQTAAEINILKPHGKEVFVKTIYFFPSLSPDRKAGSRGLIDLLNSSVICVQIPESPIPRILRPHPIEQQNLAKDVGQARKPANREPLLDVSVRIQKQSTGCPDLAVLKCLGKAIQ